jgi:hypothetical protein
VSAYLVWFVGKQAGVTASVGGKLSQLRCSFWLHFKTELLRFRYEEEEVAKIVKALRFEDWSERRQMDPVTADVLARLAAVRADNTLLDVCIKLSRSAGHDGLLRCGEITSDRKGKHIEVKPGRKMGFDLRLGRTKTDRTGPGPKVQYFESGSPQSAASLERKWRRLTGRGPGKPEEFWLPDLILVRGEPVGINWSRSMSRRAFVGALRSDIAKIGLDPRRYCGHSFRAGGATDLFTSGDMTHAEIMMVGRWKSLAAALIYFRADLAAAKKSAEVFGRAASRARR